jgi:hypothetical protein
MGSQAVFLHPSDEKRLAFIDALRVAAIAFVIIHHAAQAYGPTGGFWPCMIARKGGLGDPLLWGAAAFLLNYVPILGPLFGTIIFLLVGMLSFESLWWALFPPALYFGIHLVEGETLTPMPLARRFTLNPVLVILSLVFWFWMWAGSGRGFAPPAEW